MRPSAPVDLNLHGLGGIVVNNGRGPRRRRRTGRHAGDQPAAQAVAPRGDAGDPLLGKLAEEKEERFPLKLESDGYHYDGPSFSAIVGLDGRVTFDDHSIRDFKGLSGGFDLTDLAMKSRKQDPYRYEKEKFMENTSKLRGELTSRARKERLESALAALPQQLERVWSDPQSVGARASRRALLDVARSRRQRRRSGRGRAKGARDHRGLHPRAAAGGLQGCVHRRRAAPLQRPRLARSSSSPIGSSDSAMGAARRAGAQLLMVTSPHAASILYRCASASRRLSRATA